MSHRPINLKRAARVRKAIERRPLPAFIDPVKWLRMRRYANTAGEAKKLITDERLRINSHPVGFADIEVNQNGAVTTQRVVVDIPVKEFRSGTPYIAEAKA